MNLKEQMKQDANNLLNINEFAEMVVFNEKEIKAIVVSGETNIRGDYKSVGTRDVKYFLVLKEDVKGYKANDEITHDGKKYAVIRSIWDNGFIIKLEAEANKSVMPRTGGMYGRY